jgi:hypothetical protein
MAEQDLERLVRLLKEAAPLVQQLYDDDSTAGGLGRAELRKRVGPQTYSELTVQLTAMRSRRGYERAKMGAIN